VAHELVLEAQLVVEHTGLADHHGVLEAAAEREPGLAQQLHFPQEAEGARGGDEVGEAARRDAQRQRLVPQQRVVEADRVADLEVVARHEPRALGAVDHLDRARDAQQLARHRERPQAHLVQQDHERRGAAVEDRHFRTVHLDAHVVDPETHERRQQVLDGPDRHAVLAERRRVILRADVGERCRDLDADVGPGEADAVLGGGREQAQAHGAPAVEPDPGACDLASQRAAINHVDRPRWAR
jgi:hypothetical protein